MALGAIEGSNIGFRWNSIIRPGQRCLLTFINSQFDSYSLIVACRRYSLDSFRFAGLLCKWCREPQVPLVAEAALRRPGSDLLFVVAVSPGCSSSSSIPGEMYSKETVRKKWRGKRRWRRRRRRKGLCHHDVFGTIFIANSTPWDSQFFVYIAVTSRELCHEKTRMQLSMVKITLQAVRDYSSSFSKKKIDNFEGVQCPSNFAATPQLQITLPHRKTHLWKWRLAAIGTSVCHGTRTAASWQCKHQFQHNTLWKCRWWECVGWQNI